jgi:hypothetical protein
VCCFLLGVTLVLYGEDVARCALGFKIYEKLHRFQFLMAASMMMTDDFDDS